MTLPIIAAAEACGFTICMQCDAIVTGVKPIERDPLFSVCGACRRRREREHGSVAVPTGRFAKRDRARGLALLLEMAVPAVAWKLFEAAEPERAILSSDPESNFYSFDLYYREQARRLLFPAPEEVAS